MTSRRGFYFANWGCPSERNEKSFFVLRSPLFGDTKNEQRITENELMARTAMIVKAERKPKFMTRAKNRCKVCGRARGFLRKFKLCRICFRQLSLGGYIPGITKASW
jgi:small subunit ribosomal protein S14